MRTRVTRDFAQFYESEYPLVYRAAYALSADPEAAFDATQEAFKRAFVRWRRLRRAGWAGGWVMTTALNLCKKESKRFDAAVVREPTSVEDAVSTVSADRLDLISALRALPMRQRQAVLLYYLGDLPVPTVAELMNVAEGTVKAHLSHARAALRATLGQPRASAPFDAPATLEER